MSFNGALQPRTKRNGLKCFLQHNVRWKTIFRALQLKETKRQASRKLLPIGNQWVHGDTAERITHRPRAACSKRCVIAVVADFKTNMQELGIVLTKTCLNSTLPLGHNFQHCSSQKGYGNKTHNTQHQTDEERGEAVTERAKDDLSRCIGTEKFFFKSYTGSR